MHAIKQKKKLLSIYVKGYYKSIRVLRKIIPLQKQNNILHLQENLVNTTTDNIFTITFQK